MWWDAEGERTKDLNKGIKDGIIKEILLADDNQNLSSTAKAAAFCRTLKQKEETLTVLTTAKEKLEGEYKDLLLTWLIKYKNYWENIFNFSIVLISILLFLLEIICTTKIIYLCAVIFEFPVSHLYLSLFFLSKNLPWNTVNLLRPRDSI